ncbi:MAG TPA: A/G-specific adenine glycosylase [Gammaproteobacteria bacterium]|nr:A/G-specific adenine glycosylase [Gammaproteobacteria bacterium]
MQAATLSKKLIPWQQKKGRHDLPWQQNPTPYRVWVSEIMLQQTQVETVKAYYLRFMQQLPTLKALATSSEETVLQLWTGLGYYARARHLHRAAQIIMDNHAGCVPEDLDALMQLPGIGRSTAGAILSLGLKKSAVILDGNVKRVLTRVYGIIGWPSDRIIEKQLWNLAHYHTPKTNTHIYNQALMDLGATVCTRRSPQCTSCPLRSHCVAFETQQQDQIPSSKPKRALPVVAGFMLVLWHEKNNTVLLEKRPAPGIWGGLWCFPERRKPGKALHSDLPKNARYIATKSALTHTFSHYRWHIHPVIVCTTHTRMPKTSAQHNVMWYPLDGSIPLALAAPVRKLLAQFPL